MKNIQTSNYSRKGSDPLSIGVSATVPPWYTGDRFLELAPTWPMVAEINAGKISQEDYDKGYLDLLKRRGLTPQKIYDMLPEQCFLLCYESPKDHCHRKVLAQYIESGTGIVVPEWKNLAEQQEIDKQNFVDTVLEW